MKRSQIRKLDKAWSEKVRQRDGKCLRCGNTETLSAAHIFSRTSRSTRWDLDNGITLCFKHHIHWAHKSPIEFTRWLTTLKGKAFIDKLEKRNNEIAKNQKYEEILDNLLNK